MSETRPSNRYWEYFAPIRELTSRLSELVEQSRLDIGNATGPEATPPDLCRLYDAIRDAHEQLDEVTKALSKQVQFLAVTVLPRRFLDAEISNLTLKDVGARFVVQTRTNATILDKEKAFEWLEAEGHGALVQETVNSSTLAKFAAEYVTENGRDLPADLFKVTTIQHISRTRT